MAAVRTSKNRILSEKLDCALCGTVGQSPFQDLQRPDLERLSERKIHNVYRRTQSLYYEGNRPTGVFCIKEGRVKCYRLGPGGQRQIIRIVGPGDLLGFSAVIRGGAHAETAEALENAVVCFIPKESFLSMFSDRRELVSRLLSKTLGDTQQMEDTVLSISTMNVRDRTLRLFRHLGMRFGITDAQSEGILWLDVPLTRQEMAEMIGTSVETLIRMLAELKDEGLVTSQGRMIGISDMKRLSDLTSSAAG
ncbi:MAG: Crp/Fnr family transcriptional regulator [Deltaproteobacteria bacterium]|nr:Crp/Fnr family transcriptional regulator [Deltaproteobacteria bacterium]